MLVRAVRVLAALHTTTAVAGAQVSERRAGAFAILVALVADRAPFVAAMRRFGTGTLARASQEAAVREGVASKAGLTVCRRDTSHAAMAGEVAARQGVGNAIGVFGALDALLVGAMRTQRTLRQRAARLRFGAA